MKIDTQEIARYLFDYHEDGYFIWKNNSYKPVIGKRVYSYMRGKYLTIEYKNVKNTLHRVVVYQFELDQSVLYF